jgi:hypothetical protein
VSHRLRFDPSGSVDCLYTEAIDLRELGTLLVTRATSIEFNPDTQRWEVRAAGDGKFLHSHPSRDACLRWERENLQPG